MTRNTLSKCIASCFLVFICFSSHFALALSPGNSVDDVQGLEAMKLQEKDRAEQLVSQIDTAEDPEQIVRELEIIQNNIQTYNLRLEELREREVVISSPTTPTTTPSPVVASPVYKKQDKDSGSWFWKFITMIIIGGVIYFANKDSSSSSSSTVANRNENVTQDSFPHRTFGGQTVSTRSENSSQPNQADIQDLVDKGAKRLKSKKWQRSQAAQNGEIPPELL